MLPAARISAAIEVLDRVLSGASIDPALTNWGRANRYAGSGDRAAIRDLVFDAWRCRRSYAALGGAETGRGLMLGRVRAAGEDANLTFTGIGHAPAVITGADAAQPASGLAALDCPDWLGPRLKSSLGENFDSTMRELRRRAPVFLRVNTTKISRQALIDVLAAEGIEAVPHALAETSLEVLTISRKILTSNAFADGLFEFQDAASQAVVQYISLMAGQNIIDYCAGGGGKTLAVAAKLQSHIWAYDADAARMRALPERAKRAGAKVGILTNPAQHAPYDLVLIDAPCSGSGSWRRDPSGKWALTEARLSELTALQADILTKAAVLVASNGQLAYITCSLLADENQDQIDRFLKRDLGWLQVSARHLTPLEGGDGFYLSILKRSK